MVAAARRLERWRVTAPMFLVLAGIAVGISTQDVLAKSLNTDTAQHVAEIFLAVLLFIDATDIRGGRFGSEPCRMRSRRSSSVSRSARRWRC